MLAALLGCGRDNAPTKPPIRWSGHDTGYQAGGDEPAGNEKPTHPNR
jgi:hypothetical protein